MTPTLEHQCGHYIGDEARHCGATPTRHYLTGHRCEDHTPARLAGQAESAPFYDREEGDQ